MSDHTEPGDDRSAPDAFESIVRANLSRLADHAPTTVRRPDEIELSAGSAGRVQEARSRRKRRRFAGIGATIIALGGAVGVTSIALNSAGDGGAASPKDAVWKFVDAVQHEDILGAVDVVDPDEVAAVRSALTDAATQGKRLELVDGSFSLNAVKGVDIRFDDLALDDEQVAPDEAVVTATGGSVTASFDPTAFAAGSVLRDAFGSDPRATTGTAHLAGHTPVMLATVKRGGRWYVSVSYTVAEYARRAAKAAPLATVAPVPTGFASPEEAVTALYTRLLTGDLQGAVNTAAPGEGDALARSAALWVTPAESTFHTGTAAGLDLRLTGLTYSTVTLGDRRSLTPIAFDLSGTVPAGWDRRPEFSPTLPTVIYTYDGSGSVTIPAGQPVPDSIAGLPTDDSFGDGLASNSATAAKDGSVPSFRTADAGSTTPVPIHITRADGCTTFDAMSASVTGATYNAGSATLPDGGRRVCATDVVGAGSALSLLFAGVGFDQLPSIATVHVGGEWYVSPVGTVADQILRTLTSVPDRSSIFDSELALYIYGTNRALLESELHGQSSDGQPASCRAITTSEDGFVTGVVADPSIADVRACSKATEDSFSGGGVATDGGGTFTTVPSSSVEPAFPETSIVTASTPAPPAMSSPDDAGTETTG